MYRRRNGLETEIDNSLYINARGTEVVYGIFDSLARLKSSIED